MKNVTALALLTSLFALPAMAAQDAPFQHEAGLKYSANSEEFGDGAWNVNYRYYTAPVSQDESPYALNGFLAQTTNIGADYSMFDAADFDSIGIDGTYVFDNKWFVGGAYQKLDFDVVDFSVYKVDVGYYFNDSSKVAVFYTDGSDNIESSFGAEIRSFLALESTSGVDLGAMWLHTDDNDTFDLNADWYVTKAWSVGAGYSDDGSDNNFALKTAYWLRMSDSFSATFELSKVLDSDADGFGAGIGIVGRF
ncbi:putative porin [Shewanella sp. 1_MG-2023]|uniref:putative porin n=1 Tax=unclassified Shewanella TaxID=196818 RepID=UPI0026E4750F|nr:MULTISPECIES: putative porin [unclassified Shewanella]MDO6613036.1 putative porin [Shewanella sp. 7_MG-2023]MDO6772904.1 putative porin [Shewanella sp. 2_MG-2023]MDO6796642.1 putative porin [Shewanella sp. 1_MG-2023]